MSSWNEFTYSLIEYESVLDYALPYCAGIVESFAHLGTIISQIFATMYMELGLQRNHWVWP